MTNPHPLTNTPASARLTSPELETLALPLTPDERNSGVFALPGFDASVVSELTSLFVQGEGSTFQNAPSETQRQTAFLLRILRNSGASRILETGTHKGHFGYFLKLAVPTARLETFGIDPDSSRAISYLNQRFGDFARFHLGDSKETLAEFESETPFEFAWVDGGHDRETCLSDLLNAARLGVAHVCVDDFSTEHGVRDAVSEFLASHPYELVDRSFDRRGIVYLRRSELPQGEDQ